MRTWYRLALFCGAAPLITGTATFVLWLATQWDVLALVGLGTIVAGLILFLLGGVALINYVWFAARASDVPRRSVWLRVMAAGALLLANFPTALGIILLAMGHSGAAD